MGGMLFFFLIYERCVEVCLVLGVRLGLEK